jgi:hypothetical protein
LNHFDPIPLGHEEIRHEHLRWLLTQELEASPSIWSE